MLRRSAWFWILLLVGLGLGGLRLRELFSGFGGPWGLVQALGSVPGAQEPSTTGDRSASRRSENLSFSAPTPATPPAVLSPSADAWPRVAYAADEARDPLANLLLAKKASPSDSAKTAVPGASTNPATQPIAPPTPKIQGLMWGGLRPQAVIDGKVYTIGDTVQGARIVAIDRTGVTGEFQGRPIRWTSESRGN